MPINSVVVPFLRHGGTLPDNEPDQLSLEQLLPDLNIGRGPEHAEYKTVVSVVFAALRAAYNTLPAAALDGQDAPELSCRPRGDDFDYDADDVTHRGGGHRRRPSNNRDARRGTRNHSRRCSVGHSSSSSANKYRQHPVATSAPPPVIARDVTPHLADVSGRLLRISDSGTSDHPLSSISARSLAAAAAAEQHADAQKAAAVARKDENTCRWM